MTREEILQTALQIHSNNICLELATGTGKTLVALSIVRERLKNLLVKQILIVIPKNILANEWLKEIHKWGMDELVPFITFSTYVSLPKHNITRYNAVIYDEAHHITDRCIEALNSQNIRMSSTMNILLSATIKKAHKVKLNRVFYNLYTLKVDIKNAIEDDILPEPTVLLLPLRLDKTTTNQIYVKRKSCRKIAECAFQNRWNYLKDRTTQVRIHCTEYEYYELLESDYTTATNQCREAWKRQLAIERLKWLSEIKTKLTKSLLTTVLRNERTLTFCNSIEQCEKLGKYPIHSKDKALIENLEKFNRGEINHITAVRMTDEGVNAVNLRVGLFANLNSSNILVFQRLGRILRHEKPIIIIPYYADTREEEIVERMKDNFNPERIHIINYLNEIKSYLK